MQSALERAERLTPCDFSVPPARPPEARMRTLGREAALERSNRDGMRTCVPHMSAIAPGSCRNLPVAGMGETCQKLPSGGLRQVAKSACLDAILQSLLRIRTLPC